jgi:hypothetical protein
MSGIRYAISLDTVLVEVDTSTEGDHPEIDPILEGEFTETLAIMDRFHHSSIFILCRAARFDIENDRGSEVPDLGLTKQSIRRICYGWQVLFRFGKTPIRFPFDSAVRE